MSKFDLGSLSVLQVLGLYADIINDLRERGVLRSTNSPVADYAEYLVCRGLSLSPAKKSAKGFDATDAEGKKYEIKARREATGSKPTRFSPIRELEAHQSDYLVAVVFAEDFTVKKAGILTHSAVCRLAYRQERVKAWILPLSSSLWIGRGVNDVTSTLRGAQAKEQASGRP